jgi:hypothetical protein
MDHVLSVVLQLFFTSFVGVSSFEDLSLTVVSEVVLLLELVQDVSDFVAFFLKYKVCLAVVLAHR